MKTSTKILTALGIALFVFPVGAVLYDNMANRVNEKVYEESMEKEGTDPKATDKFLTTHSVEAFNNINIVGGNHLYASIYLVKSSDYAVKVNKKSNERFLCDVDSLGTLNIRVKTDKNKFTPMSIYVFAPNLSNLGLSNLQVAKLQTDGDSLKIKGDDLNNEIRFAENSNLKYLNLTLQNSHITIGSALENWEPNELSGLEKLQLQLDSSSINLNTKDYENVDVQLNASRLSNLWNNNQETNQYTIGKLNLITSGKSTVQINKNMKVNYVEGQLSDSTTTSLPIYMLRSLIRR